MGKWNINQASGSSGRVVKTITSVDICSSYLKKTKNFCKKKNRQIYIIIYISKKVCIYGMDWRTKKIQLKINVIHYYWSGLFWKWVTIILVWKVKLHEKKYKAIIPKFDWTVWWLITKVGKKNSINIAQRHCLGFRCWQVSRAFDHQIFKRKNFVDKAKRL